MILVIAATEMELHPVRKALGCDVPVDFLVCGVGPVEAATRVASRLACSPDRYRLAVLTGVAGGYVGSGAALLDICLADRELLGDFGICAGDRIERLPAALTGPTAFLFDSALLSRAGQILAGGRIPYRTGSFVTVSCASGTRQRGESLRSLSQGLCENMEGAAVARACQEHRLPCLELRCISNLVEDRDLGRWQLAEACQRGAMAAALLVVGLARGNGS